MSAPSKTGTGTSLLLIFSAIDLLCSAMVCGILLAVVLIGAEGGSTTAPAGDAKEVGFTPIEIWHVGRAKVEIADAIEFQPGAKATHETPPDVIKRLLIGDNIKWSKKDVILGSGQRVLRATVNGQAVLKIFSDAGERWLVGLSCEGRTTVTIDLTPSLSLSDCPGSTSSNGNNRHWAVNAEQRLLIPANAEALAAMKDFKPISENLFRVNDGTSVIPSRIGVWAMMDEP
jgi:hypothetical protein